jgi:hypothetical protein
MTFSCGRGVGSAPKILHTSDDTPIVGVPPALCRMSCPEVRGALAEGTVTLSIERALRSLHPCCRASEPLRASRVGTSPRGLGLSAARLHTHEAPADYPLSLSRTIRRARWLIFPTLRSATQVAFNPFSVSGSRCDPRAFEAMPRRAGDTSGERCRPGGAPCLCAHRLADLRDLRGVFFVEPAASVLRIRAEDCFFASCNPDGEIEHCARKFSTGTQARLRQTS